MRFKQRPEGGKGISQADFRERVFQAEERIRAKALLWDCASCVQGTVYGETAKEGKKSSQYSKSPKIRKGSDIQNKPRG